MNYDDDKKLENVTPYRATGNLNTAISNPSIDINDTMDVNIKSVNTVQNNQVNTTNSIPLTNNQNTMNQIQLICRINITTYMKLIVKILLIIRMLIIQM